MPSSSYVSYEYSRNTNWKTSGIGNENQTQFGQRQQQSNENIGNNNNKELYKSISIHNSWITMYVGSTWVCMAGKVTGQNVCVSVCDSNAFRMCNNVHFQTMHNISISATFANVRCEW